MKSTRPRVIFPAILIAASCLAPYEELPPAKHGVEAIQPKEPCFLPPLPPVIDRPIVRRPSDPGRCLAKSFPEIMRQAGAFASDTLPLRLQVSSEGKVVDVEYYDSCVNWSYTVDPTTDACIRRELAGWLFARDPDTCPRSFYIDQQEFALAPPAARSPGPGVKQEAKRECGVAQGT